MTVQEYIKDGTAIYERSFAIIRGEADLSRFSESEADIAVRMIHACGLVEAAQHFVFSPDFAEAGRQALASGAPIFCDSEMVPRPVTHTRGRGRGRSAFGLLTPSRAAFKKGRGGQRRRLYA